MPVLATDVKYFLYQYNDVVKIKCLIPVGFYQGTCVLTLTRGSGKRANEKQILKYEAIENCITTP